MKILDNLVVRIIVFVAIFFVAFMCFDFIFDVLINHKEGIEFSLGSNVVIPLVAGTVMAITWKSKQ